MLPIDALLVERVLACPQCKTPVIRSGPDWHCSSDACSMSREPFVVVAGVPALVDYTRSVLSRDALEATNAASLVSRTNLWGPMRQMLHPANVTAERVVSSMVSLLTTECTSRPRILVIGGGAVGEGLEALYLDENIDIVGFDVYASKHTQFVADGHQIPLTDGAVDGVIIQAVLEHVLEPAVVVSEIERVLRHGGLLYADTPFMQQVHEGAYDFTRFTESGHRFVFRNFERIESGVVAGAGTALRWSINYFVRALTRSVTIGRIAALLFFWLSHMDRFLDPSHSADGASSVYFFGRKSEHSMTAKQAISHYRSGLR